MNQEELIEAILNDFDKENLIISSEDEEEIREILEKRINQYFSEN